MSREHERVALSRVAVDARSSYHEAGRTYGETFAAAIAREVSAYEPVYQALGMDPEEVARRAEAELVTATERVFPDYVGEVRGRAEGAGVDFRSLFALNCIEEVMSWVGPEKLRELSADAPAAPGGHCTTFALRRDGRAVLGHNEDWWAVDLDSTMVVNDVVVPDGTRFLSPQLVGLIPWGGLNSHGLAITANTLPTIDGHPGVANAFVLRRLLECRSLEEVWEHVRTPERGLGTYVLAGDARGRVWAMETSAREARLRQIEDWTAETNHFTERSMLRLRALPVLQDSPGRLRRAKRLIGSGMKRDEELLRLARSVLTDHQDAGGRAICGHAGDGTDLSLEVATIASVVYEPCARRMWATAGAPCLADLRPFELS